jgi:uncharacterized protein
MRGLGPDALMAKEPRVWQRMLSGRRLDLVNPSPLDVELDDIAHGLARVARWNGQTVGTHIFSVAQHSLLVEGIAHHLNPEMSRSWRLAVLLHDAPEYVIGDIISPFKAVIGDAYKVIEARLLAAIHLHFGLPPEPAAILKRFIKRADRQAAYLEATRLAGFAREEAIKIFGRPEPLPRAILAFMEPWPVAEAQERYRGRIMTVAAAPPS